MYVVNVCEPVEFAEHHTASSISIPVGELWARFREIPPDKAVVVYCDSTPRGEIGARELVKLGVRSARNFAAVSRPGKGHDFK